MIVEIIGYIKNKQLINKDYFNYLSVSSNSVEKINHYDMYLLCYNVFSELMVLEKKKHKRFLNVIYKLNILDIPKSISIKNSSSSSYIKLFCNFGKIIEINLDILDYNDTSSNLGITKLTNTNTDNDVTNDTTNQSSFICLDKRLRLVEYIINNFLCPYKNKIINLSSLSFKQITNILGRLNIVYKDFEAKYYIKLTQKSENNRYLTSSKNNLKEYYSSIVILKNIINKKEMTALDEDCKKNINSVIEAFISLFN